MVKGTITNDKLKEMMLERTFMTSTTLSRASQFKIGTGQVLLDEGSTDLSYPVYFTGTDSYKDFTSGFPTLSTSATPEVTINCRIGASQGTGNDINTIGIFNTDSSPTLLIQMNHTAESKSATDEFVYIIRYRVI